MTFRRFRREVWRAVRLFMEFLGWTVTVGAVAREIAARWL